MKFRLLNIACMLLCLNGWAQSGKPTLKDDLIKGKDSIAAQFIPMVQGNYLYKMYVIPPDEFVEKINNFKAAFKNTLDAEKDAALRELKKNDIEAYARNTISWYTSVYGMDSLGMANLEKVVAEKKGDPNFYKLLDSASKKAFVKKLSPEERTKLTDIVTAGIGINDGNLFKRSAAYRKWIDNYITKLKQSKYKSDTTLGYEGTPIVKLKIVNAEISDPFIKEYLNYELTGTIIKSVKNVQAKEEAYQSFLSNVTNPAYRSGVKEIYDNYKMMSSNAAAPNFVYTTIDNKKVALKDLRGKYVYIDVWATWCAPCKAEIPFLTKVEEEYKDRNIHFVSLSVDRIADKSKWQTYVKEHDLQGIQLMADNDFNSEFVKKFNINSIPRFILIDPSGKIVDGNTLRPSDPELKKMFNRLL